MNKLRKYLKSQMDCDITEFLNGELLKTQTEIQEICKDLDEVDLDTLREFRSTLRLKLNEEMKGIEDQ